MKRELWRNGFTRLPTWPCYECREITLTPDVGSLVKKETERSKRERQRHYDWEPNWLEEYFSIFANCTHLGCGAGAVISGRVYTEPDWIEEDENMGYVPYYCPKLIHPSPLVISIPDRAPIEIWEILEKASALIWIDFDRAANCLRTAVEQILTAMRVRKTRTTGAGRRKKLNLHDRIVLFAETYPESASLLTPIRIFGNSGSHESPKSVGREELLDAFEVVEFVLHKLYDTTHKDIAKKAKKLAKNK